MQPTEGRIVQYRLTSGVWRPAIVVDGLYDREEGTIALCVFTNPVNGENRNCPGHSAQDGHTAFEVATEGTEAGNWRWPNGADGLALNAEEPTTDEAAS